MTEKDVDIFDKVYVQLQTIHNELSILSKKTPDGAINTFKLKFVNQLLEKANQILIDTYKPLDDFDLFDAENMPTNSDVVFILAQYLESLDRLKGDYVERVSVRWFWILENDNNEEGRIETSAPAQKYRFK